MKKVLIIVAAFVMCFSVLVSAASSADVTVKLDGKVIDCASYGQPVTIVEGRTLVPLRAIFEALGASVEWDNDTRTVTSALDGISIKLTIGQKTLYKNGYAIELDVPAMILNSRTLVPARAVAESFGVLVDWDNSTRTVILTSHNAEQDKNSADTGSHDLNVPKEAETVLKSMLSSAVSFDFAGAAKHIMPQPSNATISGVDDFLAEGGVDRKSLEEQYMYEIGDGSEKYRKFARAVADVTVDMIRGILDKLDYRIVGYSNVAEDRIESSVVLCVPDVVNLDKDFGVIFDEVMDAISLKLLSIAIEQGLETEEEMLDVMADLFKENANPRIDEYIKGLKIAETEPSTIVLIVKDGKWFAQLDAKDIEAFQNLNNLDIDFFE